MKRIGVIGTGTMGAPMAHNLLKRDFEVTVFNRTAEKCAPLADAGAVVADSITTLAIRSEVVLLMLPDVAAVRNVSNSSFVRAADSGCFVVDCSTIGPDDSRAIATELGSHGIAYLDAPVTGSRPEAESGRLRFLVGGARDAFETCRPIFDAMGEQAIYLGPNGMGTCAKLGNNLMGAIHMAALAEAMNLVESYGLDPRLFLEIIRSSGARSAVVEAKGRSLLDGDFEPKFKLRLMRKDVELACRLGKELKVPGPVLAAAEGSYRQAERVYGESDMCALYQWYREQLIEDK